MPRYIDRDALMKALDIAESCEKCEHWVGSYCTNNIGLVDICETIADAETIEVVRCKDCKHWERDVIFQDGWCRGRRQGDPNWFCADGERREDGD